MIERKEKPISSRCVRCHETVDGRRLRCKACHRLLCANCRPLSNHKCLDCDTKTLYRGARVALLEDRRFEGTVRDFESSGLVLCQFDGHHRLTRHNPDYLIRIEPVKSAPHATSRQSSRQSDRRYSRRPQSSAMSKNHRGIQVRLPVCKNLQPGHQDVVVHQNSGERGHQDRTPVAL